MVSGTRQIRTNRKGVKSMNDYILQVENLKTYFKLDTGTLKAVDDVTFQIKRGETLGVVGESGCGTSTTGRLVLRRLEKTDGQILYDNLDSLGREKQWLLNQLKEQKIADVSSVLLASADQSGNLTVFRKNQPLKDGDHFI